MIKDMTDAALNEYIANLRTTMTLDSELRRRGSMARNLRHLDIAIAVKRQRAGGAG